MINVETSTLEIVLAFLDQSVAENADVGTTAVSQALGCVLSENLYSAASLPRFDNSAMDGYAIGQAVASVDGIVKLKVAHTIPAGDTKIIHLHAGEAAHIMTGARVPEGTGRIVMQEYAERDGEVVRLNVDRTSKPHIRRTGEDVPFGSKIVSRGTRLGPGHIALIQAAGVRTVRTIGKPKVALLSNGNELVDGTDHLADGQIYDTNRPMLRSMLVAAGADVKDLGITEDEPRAVERALMSATREHALIVSSGGASSGFADHLMSALGRLGNVTFWKLNMRPGKPIGFGMIGECPILILPGNPVAAAAGFAIVGRVILRKLNGLAQGLEQRLRLPISRAFSLPRGRVQVLMATLEPDATRGTLVSPLDDQGSASYTSLAKSQVLAILGPDRSDYRAGDLVDVIPLWETSDFA